MTWNIFLRFVRTYAFCNVEISLSNPDIEDKTDLLDENFENSQYLIQSNELDDLMTLDEIKLAVDEYIRKDQITHEFYITDEIISKMIPDVSVKMIYKLSNNLEKAGYLELCWDANKEDFIYRKKENKNEK